MSNANQQTQAQSGMIGRERTITVEYSGPWMVKLQYFKPTGKFYSEGEYKSDKLHLHDIWSEVTGFFARGFRPGLVDGKNEFITLVEVPSHPHNHPWLWVPEDMRSHQTSLIAQLSELEARIKEMIRETEANLKGGRG